MTEDDAPQPAREWALARGHTATLTAAGLTDRWTQGGYGQTSHTPTGAIGQVVLTRRRGPFFGVGWLFVVVSAAGVVYDGVASNGRFRFFIGTPIAAMVGLVALCGIVLILANLTHLHVVIRGHGGHAVWASPRSTPAATLDEMFHALTEGGGGAK